MDQSLCHFELPKILTLRRNQNALGGAFSNTLFFDAIQCEDTFTMEDDCEQDWPLVATEGETASILQLISDHVVDFAIDCTRAREARQRVENSRKAGECPLFNFNFLHKLTT